MEGVELAALQAKWKALINKLAHDFGDEPDLQAILFLIGVQELGKGPRSFTKDEKQDLMHIATCRLLSSYGYYIYEGVDEDGWPHWEQVKQIPVMTLKEQDLLLKQAVINYFGEEIF